MSFNLAAVFLAKIIVESIPDVAHGGQANAYVQAVWTWTDSFRYAMGNRDAKIKFIKLHGLHSERI